MHFKVSTVLPMPAAEFFLERDSAAFRSLVARRFAPTLPWNPFVRIASSVGVLVVKRPHCVMLSAQHCMMSQEALQSPLISSSVLTHCAFSHLEGMPCFLG